MSLSPALSALSAYRQFIIYRLEPSASRPGKMDKLPIDYRTGQMPEKGTGGAHNPEIWLDYETAQQYVKAWGSPYGLGFVFTERDPFYFLDIDNCRDGDSWNGIALSLCSLLSGAAVEVSQSGKGLHIFFVANVIDHGCRNELLGLELYHSGRFVALTDCNSLGNCSADLSQVLPQIVATYFPPDEISIDQGWTDTPSEEWNGPKEDSELIRRAMMSRSTAAAFGNRASFSDLWLANEQVLSASYPDPVRSWDCSLADAALAQHLAFWAGRDCERIRRIMWMSALRRDKWEREDYLPRTILKAVRRQVEVLQDKRPELTAISPTVTIGAESPAMGSKSGSQILAPAQQLEMFKGCVYIRDQHRVLCPGGMILKPEQFKVQFGGFTFQMDNTNEKVSRDAWEAFSQSQAFVCPKVDGTCFRPDLPPGEIVLRSGQRFVNTYFPVPIARKLGDPSPFLNHLAKILPDERDRLILLAYMAACVQHQGVKFQWAPLIQGVEGNGKTMFTRCVGEAVGRRYVHWPKASKLAKEFNAWMVGKVFYGVEDIYVPDARREVIEELKPMITGENLEIEAKGIDQTTADICGNFIFNSNHKDAIKKTANDRRFCLFFTAQQQKEDLERDGMGGEYFPRLYEWLRGDGYAIVNEFLHTYQISAEFNPAGECQRAPVTSTTQQAIEASQGSVEQEIDEAIAQGLQGFAGGWISSIYLERLLDRLQLARKITHNKRKEMLEQMGFIYHPALPGGRVNNIVLPEGGKPRLFVKKDSLHIQLRDPAAIGKAYEEANTRSNVVNLPFASHR